MDENGELYLIYEHIKDLKKEGRLQPKDLICTFLKRRVSPLQMRSHKICHMSGRFDPNRISTFELSDAEVWKRLKVISSTQILVDWKWGKEAYSRDNMPPVSVSPNRVIYQSLFSISLLLF